LGNPGDHLRRRRNDQGGKVFSTEFSTLIPQLNINISYDYADVQYMCGVRMGDYYKHLMARHTKFKKSCCPYSYMGLSLINRSDFVYEVSIVDKRSLLFTGAKSCEAAPCPCQGLYRVHIELHSFSTSGLDAGRWLT
jgi:hypothetical protein